MDIQSLKKYIHDNNKIEYVLSSLGCHNIKYNAKHGYYSAAQSPLLWFTVLNCSSPPANYKKHARRNETLQKRYTPDFRNYVIRGYNRSAVLFAVDRQLI